MYWIVQRFTDGVLYMTQRGRWEYPFKLIMLYNTSRTIGLELTTQTSHTRETLSWSFSFPFLSRKTQTIEYVKKKKRKVWHAQSRASQKKWKKTLSWSFFLYFYDSLTKSSSLKTSSFTTAKKCPHIMWQYAVIILFDVVLLEKMEIYWYTPEKGLFFWSYLN